jgi:hypothetical protein
MTIKPKWDAKSAGEYERRMKAEKEDDDDIQVYKKPWVGLTDEEIEKMRHLIDWTAHWSYGTFAKAIEAKLKEKNAN